MECKGDCIFNIDGKCTKQSKENMTPLEEWKNDFKGFINELSMPKDDYNGIMQYIDEVPNEAKWIPVSENLPKENITVLGTTKFDDIYKTELYDDCGAKMESEV